MKKVTVLCVLAMSMMACNSENKANLEQTETTETQEEQPLIGGDKDSHGCLVGAGESWSELRQSCLQIFNEGTRLNPVEVSGNDAVISAFVLFNEDKTKVEVFLPNDESEILSKKTEGIYADDEYEYNDETGVLSINGKEVYKK